MPGPLHRIGSTAKLAIVLVLLILLPAVFYSAYEITSLTKSEGLIGEIYRQQLDVVLFSLNQFAWDAANSWANSVNNLITGRPDHPGDYQALLSSFLNENSGISSVFLSEGLMTGSRLVSVKNQSARAHVTADSLILGSLRTNDKQIKRLYELRSLGYRKLIPISLGESADGTSTALVFVAGNS